MTMKKWAVLISAVGLAFSVSGCSSDYVMATKDGRMILTDGKPTVDDDTGLSVTKISRVIKCRSIVTTFRKSLSVNLSPSAPASVDAALTDNQSFEKSRDTPGRRGFHPPPLLVTRLF
jgi:hypothetical protein